MLVFLPSFWQTSFAIPSGKEDQGNGEGQEEKRWVSYLSLLPCAPFSFPYLLVTIFIISFLGKGNLVQLDARPEKLVYFTRSSLSVLGKEECQIALLFHQGTAF